MLHMIVFGCNLGAVDPPAKSDFNLLLVLLEIRRESKKLKSKDPTQ